MLRKFIGPMKSDHNKWLITLNVFTLSSFHVILFFNGDYVKYYNNFGSYSDQ